MVRVGIGWDAHPFGGDGPLKLGGAEIPGASGLKGHSDADVLIHAICDAILGAAGLSDLGTHFPDSDPLYKNISSLILLKKVGGIINAKGYKIGNIDSVIIAQTPRLSDYLLEMKTLIAATLGLPPDCVCVKASSPEGLGSIGRSEGITAQAVACIESI